MNTPQQRPPRLPATVLALGWVSFCTDLSSEMIVPLLPAFLASLGAGPAFLGLLEGTANAVVAVLKGLSGRWSDRSRSRKGWVLLGYGLSSCARPLLALAQGPLGVLGIRTIDRVGKGLRSAPRDALIMEAVPAAQRGAAFGLQRAMDHAGALFGPLLAALLLWLGASERSVFALSAVPAAVAVLVLWLAVREGGRARAAVRGAGRRDAPGFRPFLVVASLGGLGHALDLLLLYRVLELGMPGWSAGLLWAGLHVVRATLALPLGTLSDRMDRRAVIAVGLGLQAAVWLGFGVAREAWLAASLFVLHGLHAAFTEGAERGMVADLTGGERGGAAFGLYHMTVGLVGLPLLWGVGIAYQEIGAIAAFHGAAGCSLVALAVLLTAVPAVRRMP